MIVRRSFLRLGASAVALACVCLVSSYATAEMVNVGINHTGNNSSTITADTGVGGTVLADWNNISGQNGGPTSLGGLTVSWGSANGGWRTNSTNNGNLTNGYLDINNNTNEAFITVSGLNSVFTSATEDRDIYVYFGSDGAGRTGHVYLNPVFDDSGNRTGANVTSSGAGFEFDTQAGNAGFTQTTDTTFNGTGTSSNYALFNVAAGVDGFTVAVTREGVDTDGVGLHGIEITGTAVPEPGSLLMFGVGAAVLGLRRRR